MPLISGKTQLLAVIGDPVSHSLSPAMHNAAIAELGVNYCYVPLPIKERDLETALRGLAAINVRGFNVTIPHKQTIIPLLSRLEAEAKLVGAANTIWQTDAGWAGTNTDVFGFMAPLSSLSRDWTNVKPVILGYGGAARAVVVGCSQLGCTEVAVAGRNLAKAQAFARSWEDSALIAQVKPYDWETLADLMPETGLLVNTTPVGMTSHSAETPVSEEVLARLPQSAIAYDLIYTPRPTKFLKLAAAQGAITIDGLEMLIQQGAAALKIWLQREVPVETMRRALLSHFARS
ncbi:MAG: shikimate dehydrogenase [Cyanobacteria bacterium P01_H01_bin.15]